MRRIGTGRGVAPGFSLIEALVVMVVLLIGILAVARLFPGGFLTIRRTSERTLAQSLAAQQLEEQRNQLSVADAIVSAYEDPVGNIIIRSNVLPNDLREFTEADAPSDIQDGVDLYYEGALNRIRRILGETFRIPVANPNAGRGYGPVYLLKAGPVFNRFKSSLSDPNPDSLSVYGTPMERIEQSSVPTPERPDATPLLQNSGQYAIDYQANKIAFFPRRGTNSRLFQFTYDYYVTGSPIALRSLVGGPSTVVTVPDVPDSAIPVGEEPLPQWISIPLPSGALGIKRGSDEASRKFRLVSLTPVNGDTVTAPTWTEDPYEYAWYSRQEPGSNANVGALIFNPRSHQEIIQTSRGPQTLTARVDYSVFDNHIVREDRSVPSRAPYDIKLALPFVLTNGDVQNDDKTYNGMFRASDDTPDVLIYNANTGEEIGQLKKTSTTWPGRTRFTLDGGRGILTLNQDDVESRGLQSATLRFFYRTQDGWGMQLQKANAHYAPSDTPYASDITYRNYYVGGTLAGVGSSTRVYFPRCESGKSVILGEFVVRTNLTLAPGENPKDKLKDSSYFLGPDGATVFRRFTGETYRINDNAALFDIFDGQEMTWIDLQQQHQREISSEAWQLSGLPTGRAVSNVRGASFKSRVAWKSGVRWRTEDNDTILVPPAQ